MLAFGKSVSSSLIAVAELLSVQGKSSNARPPRPCSRSARADARARVPAPPVMTALPVMAKRVRARSDAESEVGTGGRGAVSGFDALERFMVGIVRVVRDDRSSGASACD